MKTALITAYAFASVTIASPTVPALFKREPVCDYGDSHSFACSGDVADMVNQLYARGDDFCSADPNGPDYPPIFATSGYSHVSGESVTGEATASKCADVAAAVQHIIDVCTDLNLPLVRGTEFAGGNGNLNLHVYGSSSPMDCGPPR